MLDAHDYGLLRLHSFLEVAKRGSVSAAARALGLTQPAVSRQIQQVEADFGAALLHRSPRGVVLTEAGRIVEREARALLDRYARTRETVQAYLGLERGTVRVGGGATAVSYLLPEVIRSFRSRHTGIVFHLKEAGSREVERDVLAEEVDLGIVTLPLAASSRELEVASLRSDGIVLVAAATDPLAAARKKRVAAAALDGRELIGFERGSAIRQTIDEALEKKGVSMRVVMELRSIPTILRMVGLGLGLAFVSELGLEERDPRVKAVPVAGLKITRTLAVITRRAHPLSAAAQAFLDHLRRPVAR